MLSESLCSKYYILDQLLKFLNIKTVCQPRWKNMKQFKDISKCLQEKMKPYPKQTCKVYIQYLHFYFCHPVLKACYIFYGISHQHVFSQKVDIFPFYLQRHILKRFLKFAMHYTDFYICISVSMVMQTWCVFSPPAALPTYASMLLTQPINMIKYNVL